MIQTNTSYNLQFLNIILFLICQGFFERILKKCRTPLINLPAPPSVGNAPLSVGRGPVDRDYKCIISLLYSL
jgi:hypothetical protein